MYYFSSFLPLFIILSTKKKKKFNKISGSHRKLHQCGEKKGFNEKGKWITPEMRMRINH